MPVVPPPHGANAGSGPPPLCPGVPVLGSLPRFRRDPMELFTEVHARYGDTVRFKLPAMTAVLVSHPDDVEHVLVTRQRSYSKQTRGYNALRKMLGNGLVTSEGSFWLRQRRIAQPGFHRDRVAAFAEIMSRCGREMVDAWAPHKDDGRPFDVAHELMQVTLRVVGERYAYFPFSGGPRKCIGDSFAQMEAPLILASVLQRAKLTTAPDARIEIEPTVTLRPKHGMSMIAHRP